MEVTVKLGSALHKYRPDGQTKQIFPFKTHSAATVTETIRALGIPDDQGLLVIVNGALVVAEQRDATVLKPDDAISLMPPIHAG